MDESIKSLKGSKNRDSFKHKHKELNKKFYASDADLCLIDFEYPGVVAYLDYKKPYDNVTSTEEVLYTTWMNQAPVYIVEGDSPENGPFSIYRFFGDKNNLSYETTCGDWIEFEKWECDLRLQYKKRKGWNGRLRKATP